MTTLSIIIVNYNVKPFLEQALHSIEAASGGLDTEVFVVDNASTDGSVAMVQKRFPHVKVIANRDNVGFSKANNQAIAQSKGDVLCLINPDTLVKEDTFRVCLDYLTSHPAVGMVGCKILNSDGTLQLACRRSFPSPWVAATKIVGLGKLFPNSRLFGKYNLTYLDPEEISEVEAISGSFMVVRKSVVDSVGLLDENFFLYGEDLDWCYRIHQAGWKIMYLPTTQIIHYKGRSTQEASFDYLRVFYGAMQLFVQKHFKSGWYTFPQWVLLVGIWLRGGLSMVNNCVRLFAIPIVDTLFMQCNLAVAIFLRFQNLNYWQRYHPVNLVYTLFWIFSLYVLGAYKKGTFSSSKAIGGVVLGLLMNTSFTFFFPQYAFSRQVMISAALLNLLVLAGWRIFIRLAARLRRLPFIGALGKRLGRRRVLIVGTDSWGQDVLTKIRNRAESGYDVIGFLGLDEDELSHSVWGTVPVLGTLDDLERIAQGYGIHEVIFSPDAINYRKMLGLIALGNELHLDFKMIPREMDVIIGRTSLDSPVDIPLVDLDYRIFSGPNELLKRLQDLTIFFVCIPFLLVSFLYIILHPQLKLLARSVCNAKGQPLTMREVCENGRKKRGWLGLVPGLWYVALGKMSLVGSELLDYAEHQQGKGFKPGLTGLVQVNLHKNLTEDEKERYHLYYLSHYSLLLDLEILFRALFRS